MNLRLVCPTVVGLLALAALAQAQALSARGPDTYVRCPDAAREFAPGHTLDAIRAEAMRAAAAARALLARGETLEAAVSFCYAAELWKLTGDMSGAAAAYRDAVNADPAEAATPLLYGEYLRNWRGLFGAAEEQFHEAERRLQAVRGKVAPGAPQDDISFDLLPRAQVKLYERDGAALAYPRVFFGAGVRAALSSTPDIYSADVRDLTASLQFSESRDRLNRTLSEDERRSLIRTRRPLENWDRARIRFARGTAIDLMATGRITERAIISNFFRPDQFDQFKLFEYGAGIQRPFTLKNVLDVSLAAQFTRARRFGLIEFFPDRPENVNQFSSQINLSRFAGPDKVGVGGFYVLQKIDPQVPGPLPRTRQLMGGSVGYQLLRLGLTSKYRSRFDPRGLLFTASVVDDREQFADTRREAIIRRRDYTGGLTFRGAGRIDVGASETVLSSRVYTSDRGPDNSQSNSQLRSLVFATVRLLDEERVGGAPKERLFGLPVAFLNLTLPVRHDYAREGPDAYENIMAGAELTLKLFTSNTRATTFLTSIRYDHQRFYNLNRSLDLLSFQFQMGF